MKWLSIRLSVPSSERQYVACCGYAAEHAAARGYRSIAGADARQHGAQQQTWAQPRDKAEQRLVTTLVLRKLRITRARWMLIFIVKVKVSGLSPTCSGLLGLSAI